MISLISSKKQMLLDQVYFSILTTVAFEPCFSF